MKSLKYLFLLLVGPAFVGLPGCGTNSSQPEITGATSGTTTQTTTTGGGTAGSTGGSTGTSTSTGGTASQGFCPPGPYAASPLPANTTPTLLADSGVSWSEGPVWVTNGQYLLFSAWDMAAQDAHGPQTTIYKYDPNSTNPNQLAVFSPMSTLRSNGMAITVSGDVVAATDGDVNVTSAMDRGLEKLPVAQLASRTFITNSYDNLPYDAPNDLTIANNGTMYMTDSDYQQGTPPRQGQAQTRVYAVTPAGQVTVVDPNRPDPNGIALSIDQKTLYVGANDNLIMAYPVNADGSTGTGVLFVNAGADVDGMTVDCAGNVYASLPSQQMLKIWNAQGTLLGSISLPQQNSNVAFGGADRKTLFITVSGKLYGLTMQIPGWPY